MAGAAVKERREALERQMVVAAREATRAEAAPDAETLLAAASSRVP